jgi:hypothetical protein
MKTNTTARKQHICTDCAGTINKGDLYYRLSFPIMRGCSPEKSPDEVVCLNCINKVNERKLAWKKAMGIV